MGPAEVISSAASHVAAADASWQATPLSLAEPSSELASWEPEAQPAVVSPQPTDVKTLSGQTEIAARRRFIDMLRTCDIADKLKSSTKHIEWSWDEIDAVDAIPADGAKLKGTKKKRQRCRTHGWPPDVVATGTMDVQHPADVSDARQHGRPLDPDGRLVGAAGAPTTATVQKDRTNGGGPPEIPLGRPPGPTTSQDSTDTVEHMHCELERLLGKLTQMCVDAAAAEACS